MPDSQDYNYIYMLEFRGFRLLFLVARMHLVYPKKPYLMLLYNYVELSLLIR